MKIKKPKRKLVLGPIDSEAEFEQAFKKMFDIDWDSWSENARHGGSEEICEWDDGKIFAGCSVYDFRIKVYT